MPIPCWRAAALLAVLPLWGCAQSGRADTANAEPGQRVVLTTAREFASPGEVMSRVVRLAGVPVRDAIDIGPLRYRMTLVCADEAACRSAIARIVADRSFALAVEPDGRMQIPAKPPREQSR
jgi:hypothetical protein